MQATLNTKVAFQGVGLHSGAPVLLVIHPAQPGHGIVFRRTDLRPTVDIPALWDHVTPSKLCTLLDDGRGTTISTVEHVMAALAGTGIHNALVTVDGPEVPILDGSSAPFVEAILETGIRRQTAPLHAIRVLRPVEVREGEAFARLSPADHLEIDFEIDFTDAAIGFYRALGAEAMEEWTTRRVTGEALAALAARR